jgi:hypothetical protein
MQWYADTTRLVLLAQSCVLLSTVRCRSAHQVTYTLGYHARSLLLHMQTLDAVLKAKPDKEGASPIWRYTELEPEELQSVQLAAEKSGRC